MTSFAKLTRNSTLYALRSGSTTLLPKQLKFPGSEDSYYPVECEGVIYDSFTMKARDSGENE